jgi:hypothetical protein
MLTPMQTPMLMLMLMLMLMAVQATWPALPMIWTSTFPCAMVMALVHPLAMLTTSLATLQQYKIKADPPVQ